MVTLRHPARRSHGRATQQKLTSRDDIVPVVRVSNHTFRIPGGCARRGPATAEARRLAVLTRSPRTTRWGRCPLCDISTREAIGVIEGSEPFGRMSSESSLARTRLFSTATRTVISHRIRRSLERSDTAPQAEEIARSAGIAQGRRMVLSRLNCSSRVHATDGHAITSTTRGVWSIRCPLSRRLVVPYQ